MLSVCVSLSTNLTVNPGPKLSKQNLKQNPLNSTLKFLSKSGKLDEALHLLMESQKSKATIASPNLESYTALLHACISRKSLDHGQRLYLYLLKDNKSFVNNPILKSKFITLFSVCGLVDEARRVFEHDIGEIEHLPESVWVAMAIGYSKNGKVKEALLVYCKMLSRSVEPGNFAFSVALKACSELLDLRIGKGVHAQIIKANEEPDQVVHNALLRLYTECGSFEDVLHVFEEMPERNVVTWNSLIAGFVKKDQVFEALETFRRMQNVGVRFSWVSLTTILMVCARLTALYIGREIHAQIVKSGNSPDLLVLNSLLDMYAKCGELEYCRRVFDGMIYKDLTSWNTVINGYAINGYMAAAMEAFEEMVAAGFRPDEVTFVSLLSGCSHAGMTVEGRLLFDRMQAEFGIVPKLEHYACLVDMLGRAGKIEEAMPVVKRMPMNPSGSIWGSLLNSCRMYGNVSLAELVAKQLFMIEPNNPGNYVLLSNIYANAGMWDKVDLVRELMEKRGIKKEAGCSWIQFKDKIHGFVAGGGFEFRNSDEYKKVWNELTEAMEKRGYKPDTGVVLHDINEEMKAKWVCGHSERLATVFALIHRGSRLPIRIMKNLRVCADCHTWMKYVSEVTGSKIILRDTNRFHHFDEGRCSCNDYW
ncbi:Pentatricopeptide repeat-containing protein [Forsythia ovata]|uniref:Pentatricopeptide repeat-containing protein n=1 Tax=Forsythia ovata TaxID=205694 RepID=A0ABD1W427_9LAMI